MVKKKFETLLRFPRTHLNRGNLKYTGAILIIFLQRGDHFLLAQITRRNSLLGVTFIVGKSLGDGGGEKGKGDREREGFDEGSVGWVSYSGGCDTQ